jgi:hypothetical protein
MKTLPYPTFKKEGYMCADATGPQKPAAPPDVPKPPRPKNFLLGAPYQGKDREEFQAALLERFSQAADDAGEKAVKYVDTIVDRQINKASGLLAFNSILYAATTISTANSMPQTVCGFLALASSIILVPMMFVLWGQPSQYKTAQADFQDACKSAYRKSYMLTASLILSTGAAVFALIDLATRASCK